MNDAAEQQLYSGKAKVAFCRRLGDDWRYLALSLDIPADDYNRFEKGDEGRQILRWLERHNRLEALPEALEFIDRPELALILKPPSTPSVQQNRWREGSPYPGLRPFTAKYAPVFFGRDRNTAALLARLDPPDNRFLAIAGASGSGKSSLVAAGLLPRLKENAIPGSKDWLVVELTPGGPNKDPFPGLAYRLEPLLKPDGWLARDIDPKLRTRKGLVELVGPALAQRVHAQLLLFIDQFEELFTLCNEEHRPPFINMLDAAARTEGIRVVITLRSDFFPHCLKYPRLTERLNAGLYSLPTPSVVDLHGMITRPAALAGLRFEDPELPLEILEDTGTDPGALALMAAVLAELYKRREPDGTLTRAAYKALGGVRGVIGKLANEAYERLDAEAMSAFDRVFRELLEVDPAQGVPTRRRAPGSVFGDSPAASSLIREFIEARLLVCNEGMVEVAHEAVLTNWDRLNKWIGERFDDFRLLRRVRIEAVEWQKHRGHLWPHESLVSVYRMIDNLEPRLSRIERAFIRPESDRLLKKIRNPATAHQERARVGDRLAEIGDPRPGVGLREDGLPDIVWLRVEKGEVTLEGIEETFAVAPFYIAQYPLTYIQYRSFLEAKDGYRDERWWKDLAEREKEPGEQYRKIDNHPAENVSWYDAVAFCRWLSEKLNYEIRLPTEWEWQQAATGGNPANEYPWGPEWDSNRTNTFEGGLSRTTSVGMYLQGASPAGAMDMAGNVWEWCLNEYEKPKRTDLSGVGDRVVRGGSWDDARIDARAAARNVARPGGRDGSLGVRLACVSPIF